MFGIGDDAMDRFAHVWDVVDQSLHRAGRPNEERPMSRAKYPQALGIRLPLRRDLTGSLPPSLCPNFRSLQYVSLAYC